LIKDNELVSAGRRDGKPFQAQSQFHQNPAQNPKFLRRLVQQRGAIEKQWKWPRYNQLVEHFHHYYQRDGMQVLAPLRSLALNLLRCSSFLSIHVGLMAVALNNSRMLR
jgi:hypothetical protein